MKGILFLATVILCAASATAKVAAQHGQKVKDRGALQHGQTVEAEEAVQAKKIHAKTHSKLRSEAHSEKVTSTETFKGHPRGAGHPEKIPDHNKQQCYPAQYSKRVISGSSCGAQSFSVRGLLPFSKARVGAFKTKCYAYRGATKCESGKCKCRPGRCLGKCDVDGKTRENACCPIRCAHQPDTPLGERCSANSRENQTLENALKRFKELCGESKWSCCEKKCREYPQCYLTGSPATMERAHGGCGGKDHMSYLKSLH